MMAEKEHHTENKKGASKVTINAIYGWWDSGLTSIVWHCKEDLAGSINEATSFP